MNFVIIKQNQLLKKKDKFLEENIVIGKWLIIIFLSLYDYNLRKSLVKMWFQEI